MLEIEIRMIRAIHCSRSNGRFGLKKFETLLCHMYMELTLYFSRESLRKLEGEGAIRHWNLNRILFRQRVGFFGFNPHVKRGMAGKRQKRDTARIHVKLSRVG